jgi:hypothetical protein
MSRRNGTAGGYYKAQPVDFILLEKMPEIGMIGGIHWKGRRVKDLQQEIIDGGVDASLVTMPFVAARVRSMHVEGLVEHFGGPNSGFIWARTDKGTEFLAKRDEILGVA